MPLTVRTGNLIQNGGFEQGLTRWYGVTNVCLAPQYQAHQGMIAASLGAANNTLYAELYQDVPVLPRTTYRLQFFVAGLDRCPGDLVVTVDWFCKASVEIGPALSEPLTIPSESIGPAGKGAYRAIVAYTLPSPLWACFARIAFEKSPGPLGNHLLLDDVLFVAQG